MGIDSCSNWTSLVLTEPQQYPQNFNLPVKFIAELSARAFTTSTPLIANNVLLSLSYASSNLTESKI